MEFLPIIGTLGLTSISAYTDYKTGKIKNKLLLPAIIAALLVNFSSQGVTGLIFSLKGIVVPFLLLFILFALGGLGAGDIKLLCCIGAFMGWRFSVNNLAIALIIALIFMIFNSMIGKDIFKRLKNVFLAIYLSIRTLKFHEFQNKENMKAIPFAVSIFLAFLIQVVFKINLI